METIGKPQTLHQLGWMLDLGYMQCSECWKPPAAGSACQAASPQLGSLVKRCCSSHLFYASKPECEGLGEKMPRRTAAAASTIRCHLIPYWQLTHVFGRCRTSLLSCWARGTFRCTSSRIVLSKYDSWLHLVSLDTAEVLIAMRYNTSLWEQQALRECPLPIRCLHLQLPVRPHEPAAAAANPGQELVHRPDTRCSFPSAHVNAKP